MKKIYTIIAVIILITILIVLSLFNNNVQVGTNTNAIYQSSQLFTSRELEQSVNTSSAKKYVVTDGENISITTEGVYQISGSAKNVTIYVEAGDSDKVQLVLDNLSIINDNTPSIYVKTADKVFVTSNGTNSLKVSETLASDSDIFFSLHILTPGKNRRESPKSILNMRPSKEYVLTPINGEVEDEVGRGHQVELFLNNKYKGRYIIESNEKNIREIN